MANPERLSKTAERLVEDFCWVQWDGHTQRLYYLTHNGAHTQACIAVDMQSEEDVCNYHKIITLSNKMSLTGQVPDAMCTVLPPPRM